MTYREAQALRRQLAQEAPHLTQFELVQWSSEHPRRRRWEVRAVDSRNGIPVTVTSREEWEQDHTA